MLLKHGPALSHTVAHMPEECDTLNEHLFDGQRPCPNLPPGMIEVQGGRGRWIMIKKSDQPPLVAGDNLTLYTGAVNRKSGALVMQGDPGTWTPANSGRAEGGGQGPRSCRLSRRR